MNRVYLAGLGAVSPAGWGVPALREALARRQPLALQRLENEKAQPPLRVREVPVPDPRPAFLAHPRLRRATAVAQFAVGSALEALGSLIRSHRPPEGVGVIAVSQCGCVQYSCRFFGEVLQDTATASPLLFPETVFSAPASHVAVMAPRVARATTLVGDPGVFLRGLALGCDWLARGEVDAALIVSAEETNWIHSQAARHLDRRLVLAMGSGALALVGERERSIGVELERVTDPFNYGPGVGPETAARLMREQFPPGQDNELLCDGTQESQDADSAELGAWADWPGPRLCPKIVFGEGLSAGAAWQCIAAADLLALGRHPAACVSVVGCNQQAIGARFVRL